MSEKLKQSSPGTPDILILPRESAIHETEEYTTAQLPLQNRRESRPFLRLLSAIGNKESLIGLEEFQSERETNRYYRLLRDFLSAVESKPFYRGQEEFLSAREKWPPYSQSIMEPVGRVLYSTFYEDTVKTVKHLDRPVPVVEGKNGRKWNMTEDEYDLWVSLDEETTDILIKKCPQKAEVVRGLRSEARNSKAIALPVKICPQKYEFLSGLKSDLRGLRSEARKGKAIALPSSCIPTGPTTSSSWRANRIQYRASYGGGGLVHNQQFDLDGPFVCSATSTQTVNAAATSCLEDGERLFLKDDGSTPDHILLGYPGQFHSQQVDPENRCVNSVAPNQIGNGAATFCLGVGVASWMAANDLRHPPPPDHTFLGSHPCQFHHQQADPANASVNLALPNQTGNFAAESYDLETGTDSSIAENNELPTHNNKSKYDLENTFMVGSQMISTMGAVSAQKNTSEMSSNAEKLWYFLLGCTFVSLISWFYSLLLFRNKRSGKAARFVMAIAYIATAFALLAVTGLQLPDEVMTRCTLGACIISLPAIIGYAMK